jgi:polar amino acid transport system substrate-binding protein
MNGLELGDAGLLRVAVAVSQAGGAFWSFPGAAGEEPHGVAVDIGRALARHLGLAPRFAVHPNSNAITQSAEAGTWDVTFIPYDLDRAQRLDFGPVYNRSESTLLLRAGLAGETVEDIDRPGLSILAVTSTTTSRALAAWVKQAQVVEVDTIEEIARCLAAGDADAFAMSRDSLDRMARDLPGTRVARGRFFEASTAIATPPGRPMLLEAGSRFLRQAMQDGTLRRVLDANGMAEAAIPEG